MWRTARWGHGFIRIWVVLTMLWLALIGWGAWEKLSGRAVPLDDCPHADTAEECAARLTATGGNPHDAFGYADAPILFPKERRAWSRFYVEEALIPPTALLGLGLVVAWIVRGFRAAPR